MTNSIFLWCSHSFVYIKRVSLLFVEIFKPKLDKLLNTGFSIPVEEA